MADAARKPEEKAEDKAEHPTESDQEHSSTAKQPTSLVPPKEISTDIPAETGPKDHHNGLDSLSKSPATSTLTPAPAISASTPAPAVSTSTPTLKPPDPTRSSKSDEGVLVKVKSAVRESFKRQGSISSPTSLPPKRTGSSEKPEAKPTTGGETKVERDHSPAAAVKKSQASTVKDAGSKSKSPTSTNDIVVFGLTKGPVSVDIIAVHDLGEPPNEAWIGRHRLIAKPQKDKSPTEAAQSGARTAKPGPSSQGGEPSKLKPDKNENDGKNIDSSKVQIPATGASGEKTDAAGKNSHAPAVTLAAPPASMSTPKDKSNAVVVSTRSSSEFGAQEKAETQGVNWLSDLIATDIPRSRVLAFQYSISSKPNQSTSWKEDIESTAKDLLSKVKNQRTNSTSEPPPIVFVGYGFGGIIIQKAIELAFKEKSEEASTEPLPDTSSPSEPKKPTNESSQGENVPFSVEMIRQVLFLDTPFPSVTDDKGKALFPPNNNVRMFSILQDIEKRDRGSKLVKKVWARSEAFMTDRFDINWLYSKKAKDKLSNINPSHLIQDLPSDTFHRAISFTTVTANEYRLLGRIPSSKDYVYQAIRSKIRSPMLFKAIADGNAQLVSEILKCKPQEYFKNKEGQTPLHAAALLKRPNDDIVTVLIKTMPRDTTRRDKDDRVPLHLAVRTAWESGSEPEDEERKSEFSNVIKELMRNMERDNLDVLDGEGRSPWDQNLCRKKCNCIGDCASVWILELKENLDPISGPAIEQKHHQLTQRMIPKQGSPEYRACFGFDGTLSEFYYVSEKSEEQINLKTPSVYKMIYDTKTSCARILQISRPDVASPDFRCRWIHVPANNEQWLSDLFLSIGVHDESMLDQRHEGLSVVNRYMSPQAKSYQYEPLHVLHEELAMPNTRLPDIPEEPEPSPKASKWPWQALPRIDEANGINTVALFMPILAYESHSSREQMTKIIRAVTDGSEEGVKVRPGKGHRNLDLIEGYISKSANKPLHCRRTLDQYSYYMLETTDRRDEDQVVFRWAKERSQAPILMVDQLWLWVLPDGTVITSLPNTHRPSESFDIRKLLSAEILRNKERHAIQSPDDLVGIVLSLCLNIMTRVGPSGVKLHQCFQSSINTIAEFAATAMDDLLKIVDALADAADPFSMTKEIGSFSRISIESRKLVEINDIEDELNTIKSILSTQEFVLEEFQKLIQPRDKTAESDTTTGIQASQPVLERRTTGSSGRNGSTALKSCRAVTESIQTVKNDLLKVGEMSDSAGRVKDELKQLLDFKQQQASGWESRYAMKLSEQGQKQNTTMLIFTIVTIIFLPMSFLASFFAISIQEFPKDPESGETDWPARKVTPYLWVGVAFSSLVILGVLFYFFWMNKRNKTKQLDDDKGPTSDDTKTTDIEIESDDDEDDDTDNEDTDSDESDSETDSETTDYDVEMPTFTDYEEQYAPLRGRYNWHTHIPGLRLLWKRQLYPVELSVSDEWRVSHERSEWDYPLSRWRRKVRKMLHMKGPSANGDLESGSLSLPDVDFDSSDDETEEGEDIEIRVVDVDGESKSVAENELVS